ncbi:MAG: hypothetical protein SFV15_06095 [Polyangiaceae bacterium]|nr:hypothetical protein [Polyangiaceae bacterium]
MSFGVSGCYVASCWLSGCTTLGPMPATSGAAFLPEERPALEIHAAVLPGYYLSSAAEEEHKGTSLPALGAQMEPDRVLGTPGLVVGARAAGDSGTGSSLEPLLGYRTYVDDEKRLGVGVIVSGTYASAEQQGASFSATRAAAEAGADIRLTPTSHWLEVHGILGLTATALSANGQYCVGTGGRYAVDCPDENRAPIKGEANGLFPALHGAIAFDTARHLQHYFRGARVAFLGAIGTMPTLVSGQQEAMQPYVSGGVQVALNFGAAEIDLGER